MIIEVEPHIVGGKPIQHRIRCDGRVIGYKSFAEGSGMSLIVHPSDDERIRIEQEVSRLLNYEKLGKTVSAPAVTPQQAQEMDEGIDDGDFE